MLAKRPFQLYSIIYLAWLQSTSTRELQWLEYLKSVFLEIPNVTTWSVFQNRVTYVVLTRLLYKKQVIINMRLLLNSYNLMWAVMMNCKLICLALATLSRSKGSSMSSYLLNNNMALRNLTLLASWYYCK